MFLSFCVSFLHTGGPRQVTHLPPVWDILQRILVSHPKDTEIGPTVSNDMLRAVFTPNITNPDRPMGVLTANHYNTAPLIQKKRIQLDKPLKQ